MRIGIQLDDRNNILYQWDTGQRVYLIGVEAGCLVDFVRSGEEPLCVEAYVEDGNIFADIPNILLQKSGYIGVLVYVTSESGGETVIKTDLRVAPRPKPSDYVYTETEVKTWNDLSDRVDAIERKLFFGRKGSYIGTVVPMQTVGGVNAEGFRWSQAEPGEPMDEPYLNEYGYRLSVAESSEENHGQPVEVYRWLFRCIKESFDVSKRTILYTGSDGAEHEYVCSTDGGTRVALPDYGIDLDLAADFEEENVRILKIPMVQFSGLEKEDLIHALYRVQQDNPDLCFPYWPSVGGGAFTEDSDGRCLYISSAMPLDGKKSEMLAVCRHAAEDVKDKVFCLYGISPGDTLEKKERCRVVKVIHDYLVLHNKYQDSGAPYFSGIAYSVFSGDTVAVCAAFTQAFTYIARMYGIEALYMSGRARGSVGIENHAWVLLHVAGEYLYGTYIGTAEDWSCIDVYWDEDKTDDRSVGSWDYFMNYSNLFGVTDENRIGYREIGTSAGYGKYPLSGTPTGNYPYNGSAKYIWEE